MATKSKDGKKGIKRRSAATEHASHLNGEYRDNMEMGRERYAEDKKSEEQAKKAATKASATRFERGKALQQMRNTRQEIGEAVQLFQLRYEDRVPAEDARDLAKPLALMLRLFTVSGAKARGSRPSDDEIERHVARRLRSFLPLASDAAITEAVDFRQYRSWPDIFGRSRMLVVTVAECLAVGARHLKPADLSKSEWKALLARLDYASLSPEEKARKNAKAKAKRAAERAERHKGTPAFIAEQVQALGGKLHRSTATRWVENDDGTTLRENLIERIALVKDRADAGRIADIILGKFNDARKNTTKPASAVSKRRRKPAATKPASTVSDTAPPTPPVWGGPEIGVSAREPAPAADASKVASAAKKEMGQTLVLSQIDPVGGGQAASLPPAPLDTVTVNTTREEPMSEQMQAAGPDAPPAADTAPEYRELAAEIARQFARTRDEAALSLGLRRLADAAAGWGITKGFARDKADFDRRNDTLMLFTAHPAFPTASSVALRLAQADRTYEEIKTVLDIIGETPTMDETAGEMAVALFRQGHAPASVAMLLLKSSGIRGRA